MKMQNEPYKKLSREKVLDSWSVLVENGMERGKQVYEEHAKNNSNQSGNNRNSNLNYFGLFPFSFPYNAANKQQLDNG
jgi:hypothetical protein